MNDAIYNFSKQVYESKNNKFDGFVYLPGNDYTRTTASRFLHALSQAFGDTPTIQVQLLENLDKTLDYDDLDPRNYSKYILSKINPEGYYVFIGTSMGCLHIANFAHFYPETVKCLIMIEPTIAQGDYKILKKFEDDRGNGEWLKRLKDRDENLKIPANEKVIDIAVSRSRPYKFISRIPVGVVCTTRSNMNIPYTRKQLESRGEYIKSLQEQGHRVYVRWFETSHCIDTQSKFFKPLILFIHQVLRN